MRVRVHASGKAPLCFNRSHSVHGVWTRRLGVDCEFGGERERTAEASERVCNLVVDGKPICVYPLDDVLDQFGKRWTLLVVAALGAGARRFTQIQVELGGVSSRTLSERLKALDELQLVTRTAFPGVPLHVEYTLTKRGKELLQALGPLLLWAAAEPRGQ